MKMLLSTVTLFFAATLPLAAADDQSKPNSLTALEIAEGWILLFDGETTFGWKVDGDASVKDGTITLAATRTAACSLPVSSEISSSAACADPRGLEQQV